MEPVLAADVRLPETLVVGVEATGLSDEAVRAGAELAARLRATLSLVHAVRVPLFEWLASDPARGPAAMARAIETSSTAVGARVRNVLAGSGSRFEVGPVRVIAGTPAELLLAAAREGGRSWILLGPHVKRGFVDFGRTGRTLLAKGGFPVWTQVGPAKPVARILVPIDLSPDSQLALAFACRIAETLSAAVRAVHFFDAAELLAGSVPDPLGYAPDVPILEVRDGVSAEFERAMSSFEWRGVEHSADFLDGKPVEGALEASASADLVVLGTHGRTGLSSAVLGGVAHAVIRRAEAPVLAIPYPGRTFRV